MVKDPITRPDLCDRPLGHTVEQEMAASPARLDKAWTDPFDTWFAAPATVLMRAEVDAPYLGRP